MSIQDKTFKNRDGYKNNYGGNKKDYKPSWKEVARKEKEWANKTSDEMAIKVGKNMKDFIDYLDVQTKFEMYSASNALLILNQMPSATYLREYSKWKNDGYEVSKPEEKVIIIKKEITTKEDGTYGTFYNAKRLYDVSSTNAPALEIKDLPDKQTIIKSLLNSSKFKVDVVDSIDNNRLALYNSDQNVMQIVRGQDADSKIQDLVMEIAKVDFKVNEDGIDKTENEKRKFKSTCVSYMFCKKFNIDFPKDKFAELPNYLPETSKEIKAELEKIKDTYITTVDRMYSAIDRERNSKPKEQVR